MCSRSMLGSLAVVTGAELGLLECFSSGPSANSALFSFYIAQGKYQHVRVTLIADQPPHSTTRKRAVTSRYWQPSSGFGLLLPDQVRFFTPALFLVGAGTVSGASDTTL